LFPSSPTMCSLDSPEQRADVAAALFAELDSDDGFDVDGLREKLLDLQGADALVEEVCAHLETLPSISPEDLAEALRRLTPAPAVRGPEGHTLTPAAAARDPEREFEVRTLGAAYKLQCAGDVVGDLLEALATEHGVRGTVVLKVEGERFPLVQTRELCSVPDLLFATIIPIGFSPADRFLVPEHPCDGCGGSGVQDLHLPKAMRRTPLCVVCGGTGVDAVAQQIARQKAQPPPAPPSPKAQQPAALPWTPLLLNKIALCWKGAPWAR